MWFVNHCPVLPKYEAYKIWSAWIIEQRSFGKSLDFFLPNTYDPPDTSGQIYRVLLEKGSEHDIIMDFLITVYHQAELLGKAHFYLRLRYNPETTVQPVFQFHRETVSLNYQSIKHVLLDTQYYKLSTYYRQTAALSSYEPGPEELLDRRTTDRRASDDDLLHRKMWQMLNNYYLLDGHSYQWAIPHRLLKILQQYLKVDTELFASPVNAYYKKYYSLFEIDREFGSLGNFFTAPDANFQTGTFQVNPPFIDQVFQSVVERLIQLLEIAAANQRSLMFVFFMPNWLDSQAYQNARASNFCQEEIVLNAYTHYYYSYRDLKYIKVQFNTHVLVLTTELASFSKSIRRSIINIFQNPCQ